MNFSTKPSEYNFNHKYDEFGAYDAFDLVAEELMRQKLHPKSNGRSDNGIEYTFTYMDVKATCGLMEHEKYGWVVTFEIEGYPIKKVYSLSGSPNTLVNAMLEYIEEYVNKDVNESKISAAKKLLSENGFYVFKKAKKMDEAFSAMESDDKDMKYYIKELDTLVNYHNKNLQKGQYYFLCDFLDFLKDSYIYESTKLNEKSLNQYNDVIEAVDDFKGRNFAEVEQFLYDNGCECIERDLITVDGQKAYDEIWLIASADGDKQWDVRIIYNAKDKIINFVETWELT